MNKKLQAELIEGLKGVQSGIAKLASLTKPSENKVTDELRKEAEAVASKIAGLGIGHKHNVAANAEAFAKSHEQALKCTSYLLDVLQPQAAKQAGSPVGLGTPDMPGAASPTTSSRQGYRRPRC